MTTAGLFIELTETNEEFSKKKESMRIFQSEIIKLKSIVELSMCKHAHTHNEGCRHIVTEAEELSLLDSKMHETI